jgi:hypothetical protein
MAKIVVPKTPASAFNPERRPSDLIRRQVQHLEWALLPAAQRQPRRLRSGKVKTEAQAAEYIALLTERVQAAYADSEPRTRDAGPPRPIRLPKVPKVPKRRAKPSKRRAKAKPGAKARQAGSSRTRRPARRSKRGAR